MAGLFVGREREMATLEQSLADALVSAGRLVLVSGEPGIGKTRLVEELARACEAKGWAVAWGRTWEGEGTPAYFPWLEALRRLTSAADLAPRVAAARGASPELDALLGGRPREDRPSDPLEARFRLFDGVRRLLADVAEDRPVLVVLDDLHAADTSTLHLVHFLGRHLRGGSRVLLVATTRDTSFRASEEASQLLAKIAREAHDVPLGRLGRDDVAKWLASAAPELVTSLDRVHAVSEGNPLFVGELVASARKRPDRTWSTAHEMPVGIREAIRAHLALLGDETARVLEAASVLGRELPASMLAAIAPGDHRSAIEEARSAGILLETADHRLRFTHVLVREELYARLPPARRAELHRAAARQESDPALAAPHWILGARPEKKEQSAEAARLVGEAIRRGTAQLAFDDAAALGERALGVLQLPPELEADLRIAVAEAHRFAGNNAPARASASRAAAIARTTGTAATLARAALVHTHEVALGARDDESIALLREALAALGEEDSSMRAQVMARLSAAILPTPDEAEHAEALRLRDEAIAIGRRLGDDSTLFAALRLATVAFPSGTAAERYTLNAEAIALGKKLGRVPEVVQLLTWQVASWIERGDRDAAEREADAIASLVEVFPQPHYRWRIPLVRAMLASVDGRFDEALTHAETARRIGEESGIVTALMLVYAQNTAFLYTRGDGEGALPVPPFAAQNPVNDLFRALTWAILGDHARTRAALSGLDDLPLHVVPGVTSLGWPCVEIGDTAHAARLYDKLVAEEAAGPWMFGPGGLVSMGPRALLIAKIDALLGRDEDALRAFPRALALAEKNRSRPWIAQTLLAWAEVLAKRDREGYRERAASARAMATELGMKRVAARAEVLLGSPSPSRSAPPAARPEAPARAIELVREGDTWRLGTEGRHVVLKDAKGLGYLDALVRDPCRPIHVIELVGGDDRGDAGPVLDERAKRAYRERAASLHDELEEATRNADLGRAARAREELDALAGELASAVGLGGRNRRAASMAERARINVQRRLRDVVRRVTELDVPLGTHLERSVRTGMFCVYLPVWSG